MYGKKMTNKTSKTNGEKTKKRPKIAIWMFIALLSSAFVIAAFPQVSASPHTDINVTAAWNMLTSKLYPNLVILDVRNQSEFNSGYISRAILIPLWQLEQRIGELSAYKDNEILVYCRTGGRSQNASLILDVNGFTKVFDMTGGITAWNSSRYPIVTPIPQATGNWSLIYDGRSLKAYPDLKEYVWQKNASMPPNGEYDVISLHRVVKTGATSKGAILYIGCPMWGMGEQRISNPATDNWTKTEDYSAPIYWANRGFDVYAIDFRINSVPKTLNASQLSFAANWGWDVWVSDMKEAAEKVKEISGSKKFFVAGECTGGFAALNYAAKYWKTDLRGIILLDANYPGMNGYPIVGETSGTNKYNLTNSMANMNATRIFGLDTYQTLRPIAAYALQNPGAPAAYPPGNALNPPVNPVTNKTWANIT